ncbi:MAG: 16S rRNA (guanine(966)-N(2))-methyltransferase RsmD [Polyangiaceae bacterium]
MRITAGAFRSRPIRAPKGDRTRPTSDRVREALFSMLEADRPVAGARVLDLYSGTGALAFEALSRGAAHATLVEKDRAALAAIAENVKTLDVEKVTRVLATDVERCASRLPKEGFDLIFADPPYRDVPSGALVRSLGPIFRKSLMRQNARFVLELASRDEVPELAALALVKRRTYGDTEIAIFDVRS